MIDIRNLTKRYGNFTAVDNIDLVAHDGQITVLLGPNGAGKSTTIKSIAGLLRFDGEIYIEGFENTSLDAKKRFGYVSELPAFYDLLTIDEHLEFIARAYRLENYQDKIDSLLKQFDLLDKRKKLAKELSKGMTQKLSLCCALLVDPQTLLVDEPMIGLDPLAIDQVIHSLLELKASGKTIFLSTHIIDMIDDIWDVAYIMNKAKIIKRVERDELATNESLKQIFFDCVGVEHE